MNIIKKIKIALARSKYYQVVSDLEHHQLLVSRLEIQKRELEFEILNAKAKLKR